MPGHFIIYDTFAASLAMLLIGVALAFYGNRLVPLALCLCSLVIGFLHGGPLIASFTENPHLIQWGPVAVAVLLTVAVLFLYHVAFFVAGLFIGYFALQVLLPGQSIILYGTGALLAGAIVYVSRNFVFSVLTGLMGAALFATGAVNLLARAGIFAGRTVFWAVASAVALWGTVIQTKRGRKKK